VTALHICLALVILVAVVRIALVAADAWQPTPGDYIIAQVLIVLAAFAGLVDA
jgi:hypothetical protein